MIFGKRMTSRYVLLEQAGPEIVEDYAHERGWPCTSEAQEDQDRGIKREIRWLTETTITLHYERDYISGETYVYLAGDDYESLPNLVENLTSSLPVWSRDALLRAVDEAAAGPDTGRAVLRAALGAPMEFDQEFFDRINSCMTASEAPLRNVGMIAAGAASWKEFRPTLEHIASSDPDAEDREMAQGVLRAYDKFRIN